MTDDPHEELTGADGTVVARYLPSMRGATPSADLLTELAPRRDVVAALLRFRPGWIVAGGPELGAALMEAGAVRLRHAHQMMRDLRSDPPPAPWAGLRAPGGLRLAELRPGPDAPVDDLRALTLRAYPPGHPDHPSDHAFEQLHDATVGVLHRGDPPLCASSAVVYDGARACAASLVGHRPGSAWVLNIMRLPGRAYAGLGDLLLRRGLAIAAGHGDPACGLAVSDGNHAARRVYERLGFRTAGTFLTVRLPG